MSSEFSRVRGRAKNSDGMFDIADAIEDKGNCPPEVQEKLQRLQTLLHEMDTHTEHILYLKQQLKDIPETIKRVKRDRGHVIDEIVAIKQELYVK